MAITAFFSSAILPPIKRTYWPLSRILALVLVKTFPATEWSAIFHQANVSLHSVLNTDVEVRENLALLMNHLRMMTHRIWWLTLTDLPKVIHRYSSQKFTSISHKNSRREKSEVQRIHSEICHFMPLLEVTQPVYSPLGENVRKIQKGLRNRNFENFNLGKRQQILWTKTQGRIINKTPMSNLIKTTHNESYEIGCFV